MLSFIFAMAILIFLPASAAQDHSARSSGALNQKYTQETIPDIIICSNPAVEANEIKKQESRQFLHKIFNLETPNLSIINDSYETIWHLTSNIGSPFLLFHLVDKSKRLNLVLNTEMPGLTSTTIMDISGCLESMLRPLKDNRIFNKSSPSGSISSTFSASLFLIHPFKSEETPPQAFRLADCDLDNVDKLAPIASVYTQQTLTLSNKIPAPKNPALNLINIYQNLGNEYHTGKHKDDKLALTFFNLCLREANSNKIALYELEVCKTSFVSMAQIYQKQDDFETARRIYLTGIECAHSLECLSGLLNLWLFQRPADYTDHDCQRAIAPIKALCDDIFTGPEKEECERIIKNAMTKKKNTEETGKFLSSLSSLTSKSAKAQQPVCKKPRLQEPEDN